MPRFPLTARGALLGVSLGLLLVSSPAGAQVAATSTPDGTAPPATSGSWSAAVSSTPAARASRPPTIDGRDADEAWAAARPIEQFREFDPKEGGDPRFRTVAKVTYDDRNLYVVVRAYDPHPDSIVPLLSRRDVRTQSDQIKVVIDSYHDRRTGYEFMLNPAGVKRDASILNDGDEDMSWDGVWEGAARIDSAGWVAEFRIPFSQLRYPDAPAHTFGFAVWRDIARFNERLSWPLYRRSRPGFASQLGDLTNITAIPSARRLEVTPYAVAKDVTDPRDLANDAVAYQRKQQLAVGGDLKYGITPNLTLDATINPDFGQVEADPAVLNLTAFEQFFAEQRPFFLEGAGIFRFDMSCNDGVCRGLFYSRRIGRSPQLRDEDGYSDASTPTATTILGAAKLTGRTRRGLSVGVLDAVTQRELGAGGRTVEPQSNYFVGRLQQDFRDGNSGVGAMLTGVNRRVDDWSEAYLRRGAYSAGLDFRHRFANNGYQLSGYAIQSLVTGDTAAIRRTQESGVHNYQRPDAGLPFDPTRTRLAGTGVQLGLNKISGLVRGWTGYTRYSPGFEINDAGFLPRADMQSYSTWVGFLFNNPRYFYRRLQVNVNQWIQGSTGGLLTDLGGNVNANTQLDNMWFVYGGVGLEQRGGSLNDRSARGGPAVRRSPAVASWFGVEGDARKRIIPAINVQSFVGDYGRSRYFEVSPGVELRASSRLSLTLTPGYIRNHDDSQWYDNVDATDPQTGATTTHYLFARIEQETIRLRTRLNFTATPSLSLQLYAEPFVSRGTYTNVRELGDARSRDYRRRYVPYTGELTKDGENLRQLRSNTVVRWEYRPGSTLFLVWTQGRDWYDDAIPGRLRARDDARELFRLHPDNTFLIKASYWFSL